MNLLQAALRDQAAACRAPAGPSDHAGAVDRREYGTVSAHHGRYLGIDRTRDVVLVAKAADRAFRDPGPDEANVEMFRRIAATAEALDGTG